MSQCKMSRDGNAPTGHAGDTGFVTEPCHLSPPPAKSLQCYDAGEGRAVSCGRNGAMPPALLRAQGEPGGRGRLCRERKAEMGAGMAGNVLERGKGSLRATEGTAARRWAIVIAGGGSVWMGLPLLLLHLHTQRLLKHLHNCVHRVPAFLLSSNSILFLFFLFFFFPHSFAATQ